MGKSREKLDGLDFFRLDMYFALVLFGLALLAGIIGNIVGNGLWEFSDLWPFGQIDGLFLKRILFVISVLGVITLLILIKTNAKDVLTPSLKKIVNRK